MQMADSSYCLDRLHEASFELKFSSNGNYQKNLQRYFSLFRNTRLAYSRRSFFKTNSPTPYDQH
jgi:hypothetical protein